MDEPVTGGVLNSMLATVIDLSRLGDPETLRENVEATKAYIRTSQVAPGFDEVLMPGEPERRSSQERAEGGIPVDATTWQDVRDAAANLGITETEIDRAVGTN